MAAIASWVSASVSIRPGDRVRAVDGPAGVVVEMLAAEDGRAHDFVLRLPGGDLRDAPGASVISVHRGVVWLAVAAGTLVRHPEASHGVVPGARARG